MNNARKGKKRKVFQQGSTHIIFTGKSVTLTAGMVIVSRAFEKLQISKQLKSVTADIDQNNRYPTHELLQQLIVLRILGGEAIEDVRMMIDPALKGIFKWGAIAHPTTHARRLKTITWLS